MSFRTFGKGVGALVLIALLAGNLVVGARLSSQNPSPADRETAERVHAMHADFCPIARSVKGCIEVTTALHMEDV